MQILELVTTVGSEQEAHILAERAVVEKLAACVQIEGPVTSVYRWKGKIESSREYRLVFKSPSESKSRLVDWLKTNHPYELPQVIVRHVETSLEYGAWVGPETESESPSD